MADTTLDILDADDTSGSGPAVQFGRHGDADPKDVAGQHNSSSDEPDDDADVPEPALGEREL